MLHLDQGLFDRALPPPATLDDHRLERLRPKLGYPQLALAGLGLQLAFVVTGLAVFMCCWTEKMSLGKQDASLYRELGPAIARQNAKAPVKANCIAPKAATNTESASPPL